MVAAMKGVFLDAVDDLADVFRRVVRPDDPPVDVREQESVPPEDLPRLLAGYDFVLDDHSRMPTEAMRACAGLRHIIFLGTGARSYMDPEALAGLGITVHIIKGYGDTAVAEHAVALMWAAARGRCAYGPRHARRELVAYRRHAAHRQDARPAGLRRHRRRGGADRRGIRNAGRRLEPYAAHCSGRGLRRSRHAACRKRRAVAASAAD